MSYEQQKKEIETIKERTIKIKLSDADCERLAKKCGECGLTIGELFENFAGDLVDGTYSNGSDERMCANNWFERCGFPFHPKDTLLKELLSRDENIYDFIVTYDEMKYFQEHPDKYTDQLKEGVENLWFNVDYREYTDEFIKNHPNADMEKEIANCRQWLEQLKEIRGK